MIPAALLALALASGVPVPQPEAPAIPLAQPADSKRTRAEKRRKSGRYYAPFSKPNGGRIPRVKGRRDASLHKRSNRRKRS